MAFHPFSLNIKGQLVSFDTPAVMGIMNATPDSFYIKSRTTCYDELVSRARTMIEEGADIIDVGGYSTRPGATEVSAAREAERVKVALEAVRSVSNDIPVSVDTFRADVAHKAVTEWGADIINDISGGSLDPDMIEVVAATRVPYILTHMRGTPATMQQLCRYSDVVADVINWLSERLAQFSLSGANDIIIDPGFGFAKTVEQNFELMAQLEVFHVLGCPILVGISRKSLIFKTLNTDAEHSLNGTTVLNTFALQHGASILRVHDVRSARQAVTLTQKIMS